MHELWLDLTTPKGTASFNLLFKLNWQEPQVVKRDRLCEAIAADFFKRIL